MRPPRDHAAYQLIFANRSGRWIQRIPAFTPTPLPSPPLPEGISPHLRTSRRGRGGNSGVTSTQGGANKRLPWATFFRPFRAENRLSLGLSPTPSVQQKRCGTRSAQTSEGCHGSSPWLAWCVLYGLQPSRTGGRQRHPPYVRRGLFSPIRGYTITGSFTADRST